MPMHEEAAYRREPTSYAAFEQRALRRITEAGGTVVDAGGGEPFTKGLARYRDLFAGVDYKTLDVSPDTGPDIVGDIQALPFPDGSVDAFLCRSTLEHVPSPERAVRELGRSLRHGGQLYLTVPSIYPYHARPGPGGYPDYWRFFAETLELLLRDAGFAEAEIGQVGGPFTQLMHFTPPLNRRAERLRAPVARLDGWVARRRGVRNATFLLAWARR